MSRLAQARMGFALIRLLRASAVYEVKLSSFADGGEHYERASFR
jgi:hypothetical protein